MKFKFSLRWFALFFTLIAILLGAREAIRSYHWHRNLPVTLHIQSQQYESKQNSLHINVVFSQSDVERVRESAAEQMRLLADLRFDGVRRDNQFNRHRGYYFSQFYDCGPKLRAIVQERARDWFFKNPDLTVPQQYRLFRYLMNSQDPVALKFAAEKLELADSPTCRLLLPGLDQHRFQTSWMNRDKRFNDALIKFLQSDLVPEECMEWLAEDVFPQAASEIVKILSHEHRIELKPETMAKLAAMNLPPAEHAKYVSAEKLAARIRWINRGGRFNLEPAQAVLLLRLVAEEAAKIVDTPQFKAADLRHQFLEAISQVGFDLGFAGEDYSAARSQLAELAFEINCLPIFLGMASERDKEKVDWIFENRKSLMGDVDEIIKLLPNPRSGFELSIDYDWLTLCLEEFDTEFVKPKFLQMMREGVPLAFLRSGVCWEGTENEEVVELLKNRLSEVRRRPPSRRSSVSAHEEAAGIYHVLEMVSPWAASQVSPAEYLLPEGIFDDSPSGTRSELKALFRSFGFSISEDDFDRFEQGAGIVMILNQRYAMSSGHFMFESQCDSLLNASVGIFEPDVYIHPVEEDSSLRWVEVAFDDCVYQFGLRKECGTPHMLFCDVFNHILERRRIGYRFFPNDSGQIYFAPPELFQQLYERFGFDVANGAEAYFLPKE